MKSNWKKALYGALMGTTMWLPLESAWAAQYEEGIGTFPTGRPVADGTLSSGIARETHFTSSHYSVPQGREVGVYYASWGVYGGRDYAPQQVPVERLTHVYVAFGGICGDNPGAYQGGSGLKSGCANPSEGDKGAYYLSPAMQGSLERGEVSFIDDTWAYWGKKFRRPDGGEDDGQINGMIDWKNRNPDLKVVWSIGGWSYSRPFFEMASTAENRKKFINSVVAWLAEPVMGFVDGVDLDWEFPGGSGLDPDVGNAAVDGRNYTLLLKELRAALDELGEARGKHFELTSAIGVGPAKLSAWAQSAKISEALPYLDRLGLMTYDFAGGWDSKVGFNAALKSPDEAQLGVEQVLNILRDQHGVTDFSKISLGLGFYGRSHGNVTENDPAKLVGAPASGGGKGGTVEEGVFSYFDLYQNYIGQDGKGKNGWEAYYYPEYEAALLFNDAANQVISFTPPRAIDASVALAEEWGMKGVFAWTVDDDNGMLLEAAHRAYGHNPVTIARNARPLLFAPYCEDLGITQFSTGMVVRSGDAAYKAKGWLSNCPGTGEAWEQANWERIGDINTLTLMSGDGVSSVSDGTPQSNPGPVVVEEENLSDSNPAGNGPDQSQTVQTGEPEPSSPVPVPAPSSVPADTGSGNSWDASKAYAQAGTEVTHNGATWKNKWWTQGEEPGVAMVWEKTGSVAGGSPTSAPAPGTEAVATRGNTWNASTAYSQAGTEVTHNGATWKNKWWTQGEEPGVSQVWEKTGGASGTAQATGQAQDSGTPGWDILAVYAQAGTRVTYNGKTWTNKWWTQGEEPGSTLVWEQVN